MCFGKWVYVLALNLENFKVEGGGGVLHAIMEACCCNKLPLAFVVTIGDRWNGILSSN